MREIIAMRLKGLSWTKIAEELGETDVTKLRISFLDKLWESEVVNSTGVYFDEYGKIY